MPNRVAYTFVIKDRFSSVANRIKSQTQGIRNQLKKLKFDAKKAGKSLKDMGRKMRGISLASAGVAVAAAKAFGDMEAGVANVLGLMKPAEVKKFGGAVGKLSEEAVLAGFKMGDTNKALFDMISAMGASERTFDAFRTAQKLSIAGNTSLSTSVSGLAAIMNAYKEEAGSAADVANAFYAAQAKGTTDVTKLASNVGQVAPIAKAAGVGFRPLLATMAELTQGGLSTEESTTALKGVLSGLLKPTGEAEGVLRSMGVPIGATEMKAAGLANTLEKLAELSETYPDLLATAIPNIRGFTAAAALGHENIQRIRETTEETKSFEAFEAAHLRNIGTFNQEIARTRGAITILLVTLGKHLAPGISKLARGIQAATVWFRGLSDTKKKWLAWGLVVVGIISSLLMLLGSVVIIGGAAFGALAAMGAAIAGAITIPIAIAAAAVAAAMVKVYQHWDDIKGYYERVKGFFGFGNDEDINVTGAADINQNASLDVGVTVKSAKGTVDDVKTKTTGKISGLTTGTNMEDIF